MSPSFSSKSLLDLRADGRAAVQGGDPDAAEAAYRAILDIEPTDIYALVGIGSVFRLRGMRNEALQQFRQTAEVWPFHPWPLLEISAELKRMNLLDDAEAALRQALQHSPRHYHVLLALGRLLRQRGSLEEAVEFFRGAIVAEPAQTAAHGEVHIELAQLLGALGQYEEALAALDIGLEAGASKSAVLAARARLSEEAAGNGTTQAFWGAVLADKPEDSTPKLEAAAESRTIGQHEEAHVAFQTVVEEGDMPISQRRDMALTAGRVAREQKNLSCAIALFEQAVALDATDIRSLCELGDLYREDQRLNEAETIYRQALLQKPTDLAVIGGLAIVRRRLGNHFDAIELLQKASAVDPGNDWIKYEHALTLRDMGRSDDAFVILESVDTESSMYFWSRMTLGHMARARGDHQRAADHFEEAANTTSDPADALYEVVTTKRILGDIVSAQAAIARIFACDPASYRGHMADAYLKREIADFPGARTAFLLAAAIMPMESQPYLEIAQEERRLGDLDAATAAIDTALNIDPRHEGALLKKAAFLTETGDTEGALAIYAKLRSEQPGSVRGYLEAAQLLYERGDVDAATALFAAARQACGRNLEIDLREAEMIRRQGLLDEAFALLTLVHARYPDELWPWFARGSAAIDLGYFDLAEALLSAPPSVSAEGRARIHNLQAKLEKARWNLGAAIESLDAEIAADPNDSQAIYERAKLKLITFDLDGVRPDLVAYAKFQEVPARLKGRSANASQSPVGQFYEEFIFDRQLAGDLAALRALPPQEQVQSVAELVRCHSDLTGPAIGLMVALRRAGRFNRPQVPRNSVPRIPQLITQFWNDPEPPPDVRRLMDSWASSNPGFRIELFDDVRAFAYLRERLNPIVAGAFNRTIEPAQRADLFRLARLFLDGGYYIDADDLARGSLNANVPYDAEFFAYQEDLGSIGNNILGVVPGHPVIGLALQEAVAAVTRGDRDIVWLSTGPGLLTRSFASWLVADPSAMGQRIASVTILTVDEMRRVAAMFCHAAYKDTNRAWLNNAFPKRKRP